MAEVKIPTFEAYAYMEFEQPGNWRTMFYLPAIKYGMVILWKGDVRCETDEEAADLAIRHLEGRLAKLFE